jgi:hypothetical protein
VALNVSRVVEPYLEKLKNSRLDEKQKLYVSIIEKNLKISFRRSQSCLGQASEAHSH